MEINMENIKESIDYIVNHKIILDKHKKNLDEFCKQKFVEKFKDSPQEKYVSYQVYEILNLSEIRVFYSIKGFIYFEHFDIEI